METRGKSILIAWHHSEIPNLILAFGADTMALLPDGKWPDTAFDWIVVLRYDHSGKLVPGSTRVIQQEIAN